MELDVLLSRQAEVRELMQKTQLSLQESTKTLENSIRDMNENADLLT